MGAKGLPGDQRVFLPGERPPRPRPGGNEFQHLRTNRRPVPSSSALFAPVVAAVVTIVWLLYFVCIRGRRYCHRLCPFAFAVGTAVIVALILRVDRVPLPLLFVHLACAVAATVIVVYLYELSVVSTIVPPCPKNTYYFHRPLSCLHLRSPLLPSCLPLSVS